MKQVIAAILKRWGCAVNVIFEDRTVPIRAILAPTMSQSWKSANRIVKAFGEIPYGQFLYLGPPEVEALDAQRLECQGKDFVLRRCEPVMAGDTVLYRFGLAVPLRKEQGLWEN